MNKFFDYKIIFFFLVSFFLTIYLIGIQNITLNETDWLFVSSDLTNAQLSWQYFQNDVWRFPLGKNPNYGIEIANSIVFTDNIPLFAIVFKFFNKILPEKSQYFGLWILTCFFLQLYFSNCLLFKATNNKILSFLGSFLFLLSPFFLFRLTHHMSLGGHWLILYTFYISYFVEDNKKLFHWLTVITLSVLIHFYFTAMIFIIYSSYILEKIINEKKIENIKFIIFKVIYTLIIMYIVGYFETSVVNNLSLGYGSLNIDLLSFFDPKFNNYPSWSLFLNDFIKKKTIEGFVYIGLGNILFFLFFIFLLFNESIQKKTHLRDFKIIRIFHICIIILLFWAITTNISIGDLEIIKLKLPKLILAPLSIFGATGRFAWPVIYFIIFLSIIFLNNNFKKFNSILILSIILIIQITDISIGIKNNSFPKKKLLTYQLDEIWYLINEKYDFIRTTYLFNNYGTIFSKMAYPLSKIDNIKTDIILNAAHDRKKSADVRYQLINYIRLNKLDINTAYIAGNSGHLKQLKKQFGNQNYGFFYRDGLWIILPQQRDKMNTNDLKEFNNVNFDNIELNKKYKINFNKNFLGFGWSHNFNKDGSWSEGNDSYLLLKKPNSNKNLKATIEFESFKKNFKENYNMEIYSNQKLVKKISLHNTKLQNIDINLFTKPEDKDLEIHFRFNGLISPYELLDSPDARKLGILLKSITINEINNN